MPSQKSNHSTLKWGSPGVHLSISITLEWLGVSDNFTPLLVTLVTCLSSCLFQLWRLQIKRPKWQQRPSCMETKRVLKNPLHLPPPPPPPPHPPPTVPPLPHRLLQKEGRRRRRGTTATKKREERKQKEHQDRKERYVGNQGIRRGTSVVYYSYHLWNA